MPAGHRQREVVDVGRAAGGPLADQHREPGEPAGKVDVEQAHVGLRVLAVGEDPAVLDAPDQLLHRRMIVAHDGEAVERQVLDQRQKGVLDRVEGLEVVEVLGIDVGDDRDVGGQLQERAVALVGFDHHPVAGAEPGVGAIGVDDAAVDDGRVEPGRLEQRRHERGGRRLAVRAGDRDALLEPHQLGEHFGAANDRNAPRARRDELRIVALDGGGNDDHRGRAEIRRVVADEHRRALLAQALDVGVVAQVRALHLVAEIDEHLGDARHADAADADEVDGADLVRQFHARMSPARPADQPHSRAGRNRSVRAIWEMEDGSERCLRPRLEGSAKRHIHSIYRESCLPISTSRGPREAKLFRNNRSQAVRIPAEFELPGDRVLISRDGDRLIIEATPKSRGLIALLDRWAPLDKKFPDVDEHLPPLRDVEL